ncbi:MAG: MFS transporter [Candidatus Kapaibacterium sp.]
MKSTRTERIGWYMYDWANSAFSTTVVTVFIGPYLTSITQSAADASGNIYILGIPVFAGSFFPYLVSASVLLQVLILPLMGALADYTHRRKALLGGFAYLGAFATMGLYFLEGDNYLFGGALFLLANLSFGASIVLYNSFLADLAGPDRRDAVSSIGWSVGYIGGGVLLLLNLLLFSNAAEFGISEGHAVRISLTSAGMWWALFTIFPMITLRLRRPTREIPGRSNLLTVGFRQLAATIREARNYPKTLVFLGAYLLYNDGVQAVIALSAQFGQEELGLPMSTLTQVILLVQFVAFGGALLFSQVARVLNSKNAILITLVIWLGAIFYAYMYLHTEAGFFALGAAVGLVMGGTQALSRSLFSLMIPPGSEAEYFSLYEVSERGTSWLAPLLFGLALQFYGSYRIAILSLGIFFIAGIILLIIVNIPRGIIESGNQPPKNMQ